MALRDHIHHPERLSATERAALVRWRAVYVLGSVYGRDVATRLLFLRWLYRSGRLAS